MASMKSSNSNVRSMCFFSSSHSGTRFMRSFNSGALIKSAITGQRVTPENRFATAKCGASKIENFLQIFHRIKELDRARARLAGASSPVFQDIVNRSRGSIQILDKIKTARGRQIFSRAAVFGHDRTARREKCRRAIAHPPRFPTHIDAFDGGEFTQRTRQIAAIFFRRGGEPMRIDNAPAAFAKS